VIQDGLRMFQGVSSALVENNLTFRSQEHMVTNLLAKPSTLYLCLFKKY